MTMVAQQSYENVQNHHKAELKPLIPYNDPAFSSDPSANPDHATSTGPLWINLPTPGYLQLTEQRNRTSSQPSYVRPSDEPEKQCDAQNMSADITSLSPPPHVELPTPSTSATSSTGFCSPPANPPAQALPPSKNKTKEFMAFLFRRKGNNKSSLPSGKIRPPADSHWKSNVSQPLPPEREDSIKASQLVPEEETHTLHADPRPRMGTLDMIDELDETNPLGHVIHHGGPYEAAHNFAKKSAHVKAGSNHAWVVNGDRPMQRSSMYGVSLNVRPGQIFPTDGYFYPPTPLAPAAMENRAFPYQTVRSSLNAEGYRGPMPSHSRLPTGTIPSRAIFSQQSHVRSHSQDLYGSQQPVRTMPPSRHPSLSYGHNTPPTPRPGESPAPSLPPPYPHGENTMADVPDQRSNIPSAQVLRPVTHPVEVENSANLRGLSPQDRENDIIMSKILRQVYQRSELDVQSAHASATTTATSASSRSQFLHNRPRRLVMPAPLIQPSLDMRPEAAGCAVELPSLGPRYDPSAGSRIMPPFHSNSQPLDQAVKDVIMAPERSLLRRRTEGANVRAVKAGLNRTSKPVASVTLAARVEYQEPSGAADNGKLKMGRKVLTKKRNSS